MKKIYILILAIAFLPFLSYSQNGGGIDDFDIRIEETSLGYIVIQIRANFSTTVPRHPQTTIEKLQFGIKWNREIVNGNKLDFTFVCNTPGYNPYNLKTEDPQNSVPHNSGSWDFRNFELSVNPVSLPYGDWAYGDDNWTDIAFLRVYRRTPGNQVLPHGLFYIMQYDDPFITDPPKKGFPPEMTLKVNNAMPVNYVINVMTAPNPYTDLPVPTPSDAKFTWQGGASGWVNGVYYDGYSWDYGPNWLNGCDGTPSQYPPTKIDDCLIPSGCGQFYPKYPQPTYYADSIAECNNLELLTDPNATDVAKIIWMQDINYNGSDRALLRVYGDLTIRKNSEISISKMGTLEVGDQEFYDLLGPWDPATETGYKSDLAISGSSLVINSQGFVRVLMDTEIGGQIFINSGPEGPGNFKNYGDISYRLGGDASIETYMENNAAVGAYFFHTVGPTVMIEEDYYGGGTGVALQNFDLDILKTYAYQWQEPAGEWLNVYPYLYPIQTATGLLLSSTLGSGSVISFTQTGEMLTGDVSVYLRHTNGNPYPDYEYLELISNPYPCAVSWESLYTRNSSLVNPVIRIYNAEDQAWGDYNANTDQGNHGVTNLIQVGQGFFVETNSAGHFTFTDEDKRFSSSPLRGDDENMGSLKLGLNGNGMKDEMIIHFLQEATTGIDELYDTKDWGSYYEDATQIYSLVAGEMLSVNSLPFMYDQMMSVPVHIETKAPDSYTLSFNNVESFTNTDIWLEDSYSGGELIKITPDNSTYTFFSSPDLQADRFIVHFNASFLPNAIGEVEEKLINIYAANNELYILNESAETIKEVAIFNILGQEIYRTQVPEQSTYKFKLYEPAGYYIARVITNKNVYSEKVFIKGN